MRGTLRNVGSIIAGLIAGVIVISCVETVCSAIYPPPAGLDYTDSESVKAFAAQLPLGAFLFVLAAWGAGCLIGSWLATRLSTSRLAGPGVIVGVLLLVAGVSTMLTLPHPGWFWVAAFLVCMLATYAGTRLGAGRS